MKDWDIIFLNVNKNILNKLEFTCMPGAFAYVINKKGAAYLTKF
jgi:hypothetical protein